MCLGTATTLTSHGSRPGTNRDTEGRARTRLPHKAPGLKQAEQTSSQRQKEPSVPQRDGGKTHGFWVAMLCNFKSATLVQ